MPGTESGDGWNMWLSNRLWRRWFFWISTKRYTMP